jgi:hypothetical protein
MLVFVKIRAFGKSHSQSDAFGRKHIDFHKVFRDYYQFNILVRVFQQARFRAAN